MVSLVVYLKGMMGDDASLQLPRSATVEELKTCLGADKGVPASDLSIICRGKQASR